MGMAEREYDLTLRTQGLTIPTLPDSESSTLDRRRDGLFLLCAPGLFESEAHSQLLLHLMTVFRQNEYARSRLYNSNSAHATARATREHTRHHPHT